VRNSPEQLRDPQDLLRRCVNPDRGATRNARSAEPKDRKPPNGDEEWGSIHVEREHLDPASLTIRSKRTPLMHIAPWGPDGAFIPGGAQRSVTKE
jgi:hypothetical protein